MGAELTPWGLARRGGFVARAFAVRASAGVGMDAGVDAVWGGVLFSGGLGRIWPKLWVRQAVVLDLRTGGNGAHEFTKQS